METNQFRHERLQKDLQNTVILMSATNCLPQTLLLKPVGDQFEVKLLDCLF